MQVVPSSVESDKSPVEKKFEEDIAAVLTTSTDADRQKAKMLVDGGAPVEFVEITPPVAAILWKSHNATNRDFTISKAREYANAMQRGEWKKTHQGYAFDANGKLIDGQHRLAAQALSGTTLEVVIGRNLSRDIIDAIDISKPRKAHEALQLAGISDPGEKERISRAAMEYIAKVTKIKAVKPTIMQVEKYVLANDERLKVAIERGKQSTINIAEPCLSQSTAALMAYLMDLGEWPDLLISGFITNLQKGVDDKENGVIVPTAKMMLAAKRRETKKDSLTRDQMLATMLRAVGHWARNESVAKFRPAKKTELVDYQYHAEELKQAA